MHAVRLHEFGPPENLTLEQLPDLIPTGGEVTIAVEASGVHLVDTSLRRGEAGPIPPPELPTIPGREVAGVVDALGPGVPADWLGARVVAHLGAVPGGYASQAVTAVGNLFRLDDDTDLAEAVAMVGTGRTAEGVLELAPSSADDVVLVPSAAGGLGWLLVQAAQAAGARVVAAAGGPDKTALLKELEPDLVVDYTRDDWAQQVADTVGQVTLVYDGVGGVVGRRSLELLAPGGRLEMFGYSAGEPTRFDTGDVVSRGLGVSWSLGPRMTALPGGIPGLAERSLRRFADGAWRPLVSTYPLAEAARAHREIEERAAVGKVVFVAGPVPR
jgi:NADPH2:quinone reductase